MQTCGLPADTIAKSDVFTGGFYVLKSRRTYYALLKDRVLEVYKSEKGEKCIKEAKYLFDLSLAFNIHLHHDAVLKECIALMMPDETFLMRFEVDIEDWLDMLIDKAREARATKLARPVFRDEYFEVAWDVEPVKKPKIKGRTRNEEPVEDLVAKNESFLLGKKRLCMYPHTMYIVRKGVTASEDANPPICSDDYMAFPVNAISIYGHQDRYFFFRTGRCAPTGAGELWLQTDTGETASLISDKIIKICERESEKRKTQSRIPSISTRSLRSQAHRERTHTHTNRSGIEIGSITPVRSKLSTSSFSGFTVSHLPRQPVMEQLKNASTLISKNSIRSQSTSCKKEKELLQPIDSKLSADDVPEQIDLSGGTIISGNESGTSSEPSHNLVQYDYAEKELSPNSGGLIAVSPNNKLSASRTSNSSAVIQNDGLEGYIQMNYNQDHSHHSTPALDLGYTLTEVRSYLSTSTDSVESVKTHGQLNCLGSGDDKQTYSLSSRLLFCGQSQQIPTNPASVPLMVHEIIATKSTDDPRKRAHSLGSKSWIKPLRKVSGIRTKTDHTENDEMRQRADSFGISLGKRNGSFSIRKTGRTFQDQQADDLTEWDFGATGRSGSGSVASMDGSNHSRTNSFGVNSSALLLSALEEVRKARDETNSGSFERVWTTNNFEEVSNSELLPVDDNEYVLPSYGSSSTEVSMKATDITTKSRSIGTIMEQNISSGSSRSSSPISFKANESSETKEADKNPPLTEIKQSSSAPKIMRENFHLPLRAPREYLRSISEGAVVEIAQTGLDYAALDWQRSDASLVSSYSNIRGTGSSVNRKDSETKCVYTTVHPYNP